eukprot:3467461-Rhodomonas_salina.2
MDRIRDWRGCRISATALSGPPTIETEIMDPARARAAPGSSTIEPARARPTPGSSMETSDAIEPRRFRALFIWAPRIIIKSSIEVGVCSSPFWAGFRR